MNPSHLLSLLLLVSPFSMATGQPLRTVQSESALRLRSTPALHPKYRVEARLLLTGQRVASVSIAQEWSRVFQRAGHSVSIVQDSRREKPGLRNFDTVVRAVGLIDSKGAARFGKKSFRTTQLDELQTFLADLAANGADGPIRQRPTWGLSEAEYTDVLKLLSPPVEGDLPLTSALDCVNAIMLPDELPVTWSEAAQKLALDPAEFSEELDAGGVSKGSGLAVALSQFGLGFRVMPHHQRGFLLEIDEGNETANLWPVGWKNTDLLTKVVPPYFQQLEVDLDDQPVDEVLSAVAERVGTPLFVAHAALKSSGKQLTELRISRGPARMSPYRLVRSIADRHRLGIVPRTDEAGGVFLWCTTKADHQAWTTRFSDRGR